VTTPLEPAPPGLTPGRVTYLKREDVHELGAFKWRGALPVLERYRREGADTVVTASTGNHGAALAWAARRLGMTAIVFAPLGASHTKLAHLQRLGADLRLTGSDLDEAKDEAQAYAADRGLPFFEDGAEPAQLDGYAKIGEEIVEQLGAPPAAAIVPVGNGALFAGVARALGPTVRRVAVAAEGAPVMYESWRAGRVVESDRCETIADGLAVRVAIPQAVEWLRETANEFLLVSEDELMRAVARFWDAGIRAEPAAAAALAALPRVPERPVVLVVTGRNIDGGVLERCLAAAGAS
jgi:threonine dehydratase